MHRRAGVGPLRARGQLGPGYPLDAAADAGLADRCEWDCDCDIANDGWNAEVVGLYEGGAQFDRVYGTVLAKLGSSGRWALGEIVDGPAIRERSNRSISGELMVSSSSTCPTSPLAASSGRAPPPSRRARSVGVTSDQTFSKNPNNVRVTLPAESCERTASRALDEVLFLCPLQTSLEAGDVCVRNAVDTAL